MIKNLCEHVNGEENQWDVNPQHPFSPYVATPFLPSIRNRILFFVFLGESQVRGCLPQESNLILAFHDFLPTRDMTFSLSSTYSNLAPSAQLLRVYIAFRFGVSVRVELAHQRMGER